MARNTGKNTKGLRAVLRFGSVFFALMGLVILPVLLSRAIAQATAMTWPTTEGVMTRSDLRTSGRGKNRQSYWDYAYVYTVDDRQYEGKSRSPGNGYSGPAMAWKEKGHELYPAGTQIAVRYNESDPGKSYFGPGPDWTNYALPLGGGFLLIGLGLLSWRRASTLAREANQSPVSSS